MQKQKIAVKKVAGKKVATKSGDAETQVFRSPRVWSNHFYNNPRMTVVDLVEDIRIEAQRVLVTRLEARATKYAETNGMALKTAVAVILEPL